MSRLLHAATTVSSTTALAVCSLFTMIGVLVASWSDVFAAGAVDDEMVDLWFRLPAMGLGVCGLRQSHLNLGSRM